MYFYLVSVVDGMEMPRDMGYLSCFGTSFRLAVSLHLATGASEGKKKLAVYYSHSLFMLIIKIWKKQIKMLTSINKK